MRMAKYNKEAVILIGTAAVLACSGLFSRTPDKNVDEILIVNNETTTASTVITASSVKTSANTSAKTKKTTEKTTSALKTEPAAATKQETVTEPLYLNINTASADELALLKGIGEHLAAEIIAYRDEHGGFRNIEEIMNVSGIGQSIFSDICDFIYVVDPTYDVPDDEPAHEEPTTEIQEETEHIITLEEVSPININTADAELLMLLPHVDEETAANIISLREKLGRFSNTYEIMLADGITQPEAAEMQPYITVGDEPAT